MKKLLSILLICTLVFAFAACSDNSAKNDGGASTSKATFDPDKYGLDLESADEQPMSEEMVTVEVLAEAAGEWLGGNTMFFGDDQKSYDEFVDHIGCEPTAYKAGANGNRGFIWKASDDDTAWLYAEFEVAGDEMKLVASGSANLGIV